MHSPRVAFGTIPWQITAPGARHRMVERDGKRIRLFELTDWFIENEWCLKGHVGCLIEGELEFTFDSRTERLKPGDGFLIRPMVDKPRARALSPLALLFAVEDISPPLETPGGGLLGLRRPCRAVRPEHLPHPIYVTRRRAGCRGGMTLGPARGTISLGGYPREPEFAVVGLTPPKIWW